MLSAQRFLDEVIAALRNVIAPAISDPYPKAQAYMAAVILEFVTRQVEERSDIATAKEQALNALFDDLSRLLGGKELLERNGEEREARLCQVIERLYAERNRLGEEVFTAANRRVRQALRQLLDQDLKVAGKRED
ncbi:MAG: hypothetical protein HYZ72_11315 [Deltaproteobacteria bacterium]|nr:hypothetical protein [Deltaproteobacteria bacterium]